jgi:hypothetical protein
MLLVLAGCATKIMSEYVGGPITAVISEHGMPVGSYDVSADQRAFMWSKNASYVISGSSYTSGTVIGNQMFANTYSSPSYVGTSSCNYVLIARKTRTDIEGPAAWTVTGFEKPRFGCN